MMTTTKRRRVTFVGRVGMRRDDGRCPPAHPTHALPATPAKVLVLMERARRGQSLWHPLDASAVGYGDADRWAIVGRRKHKGLLVIVGQVRVGVGGVMVAEEPL